MKLHIKKDGAVSDIQKEFNAGFPYLKIEFFWHSHANKELSPKNDKIDPLTSVGKLVKWDRDKVVKVDEKMKTIEFETMWEKKYGLFVQVFRKSGRVWLETSHTDDWSLERQNEEGKMMSSIHNVNPEEENAWDEY